MKRIWKRINVSKVTRVSYIIALRKLSSESVEPSSSATPSAAGTSVTVEHVEPPLKRFKFLQQQFSISHSQSSVGVGPETELSNYGAELCCSTAVTNCTATDFWKAREPGYPLLSKVALDLLSAPASQAYTERLFSVCGDLTAGKRNRMTTALERRVFLKVNSKYMWTDLLAFRLPIVDCQAIASTARVKRSVVMWLISDY